MMTRQGAADAVDGLSELSELMSDESDPGGRRVVDPVARRARRRRALLVTAIAIVVVLAGVGGYTGWALTAPLPAPVAVIEEPGIAQPAAVSVALPAEGAAAVSISGADAYLGESASGTWAASGSDEPRPIASISKLVTALVILDAWPLAGVDDPGPTITFSEADHDLYDEYYVLGATIVAMPAGSSMSLRDALATMLIPSASNYAEAVSTWAFGSQSAFLSAARRWLTANGLAGTTIVEPTGISARNTSTPTDLLAIAKLAAADPTIAQIVATPSLTLPSTGVMYNTNGLLGVSGITGLKTGNLGEGTHNLLYTASLDVGAETPVSVTGVMLGGTSRESVGRDVIALLDSIRAGFRQTPLVEAGRELGTYTTAWGSSTTLVASESASIFTWSDTPVTLTMQTATPTTYADGEVIGSLTWTAGPRTATAALELEGSIDPPTTWWRLTHPGELG